ncbi:MAG: tRNA pseudouridine(55) synthase TruB [Ruminococcus sp.]|nr:tRNA pseudouridine(55) synthase TruB [Ruminococcus sp.]
MKDGILCMNKPQGFTSFDVIAKLRGILKMKRLGHSGTLDPMATGVLPVFVGTATKCCDILPNDDKIYVAGFKFGSTTDTQDSTGKVIKQYPHKNVSTNNIQEVLKNFIGEIDQIPPMYSAVSIGGKRLYELARKNIVIDRPPRKVTIYGIKLTSYDEVSQMGTLEISCGKGTYVRTIINDIGESLNVGAYMTSLIRTSASGFNINECYSFEDVESAISNGNIDDLIVPTERIFEYLPQIHLTETQTKAYRNGVKLPLSELTLEENITECTVYSYDNTFIGTAKLDYTERILRIGKNF